MPEMSRDLHHLHYYGHLTTGEDGIVYIIRLLDIIIAVDLTQLVTAS